MFGGSIGTCSCTRHPTAKYNVCPMRSALDERALYAYQDACIALKMLRSDFESMKRCSGASDIYFAIRWEGLQRCSDIVRTIIRTATKYNFRNLYRDICEVFILVNRDEFDEWTHRSKVDPSFMLLEILMEGNYEKSSPYINHILEGIVESWHSDKATDIETEIFQHEICVIRQLFARFGSTLQYHPWDLFSSSRALLHSKLLDLNDLKEYEDYQKCCGENPVAFDIFRMLGHLSTEIDLGLFFAHSSFMTEACRRFVVTDFANVLAAHVNHMIDDRTIYNGGILRGLIRFCEFYFGKHSDDFPKISLQRCIGREKSLDVIPKKLGKLDRWHLFGPFRVLYRYGLLDIDVDLTLNRRLIEDFIATTEE